ncbi:MAG: hypothetical protein IPJ71_16870 [Bdellovibrionales bacterium]|nr:hypothetical protein [Bdellovibrionales bacterium]
MKGSFQTNSLSNEDGMALDRPSGSDADTLLAICWILIIGHQSLRQSKASHLPS